MTREKAVQDAMRVQNFLKDDVIGAVLARMERRYYEEFLKADSSEKRVTAWAKATTLRNLEHEMQITLDEGERAVLEIAKEARQAAQRAPHPKE